MYIRKATRAWPTQSLLGDIVSDMAVDSTLPTIMHRAAGVVPPVAYSVQRTEVHVTLRHRGRGKGS